jgi:dipeptidyl-peptidase-4
VTKGKTFFFEKKNQKTFEHWRCTGRNRDSNRVRVFLLLFLQKNKSFLPLAFCLLAGPAAAQCFANLAATRNYTLGLPLAATPSADGRHVLFLRSPPRQTELGLYAFDTATGAAVPVALPGPTMALSVAEKARRERARMTLSGITDYALSQDGKRVLVAQGDRLSVADLDTAQSRPLPGSGWIGPRFSPDGSAVAAVRDNDLYVITPATGAVRRLTTGGSDTLTHGLAEFAAAEELDRFDGTWWSPDSQSLVYEQADTSGVEPHYIADPIHPAQAPVEFRYPRAGTANARVTLGIIGRRGGPTVWIRWDHDEFPYLARVVWTKGGPLSLVLLNRLQTIERVVTVDPATGATRTLLTETDPDWINLTPEAGLRGALPLPHFLPDGSGFLWASEANGTWRMQLRHPDGSLAAVLSPQGLPFAGLVGVDRGQGDVIVAARPDRLGVALFRVPLSGGAAQPLAVTPGLHDATANDGATLLADRFDLADGTAGVAVLDPRGKILATLPSVAETPPRLPHPEFLTAGTGDFDSFVLRPANFHVGRKYPVILSVYAGPGFKTVLRAPRLYLGDQCLADQGFIVVGLDGRGTPGRSRDFERATKFDLIDLPLQDQVDGLQALGRKLPEMDMTRVGVTGWSFGGYFTAMAASRRPDVFRAGVAGAPVVDFADYDTAYTERYLGLPQDQPQAYRLSNVLTYAARLDIPLLIMHGLTDDNVYFENTVKLTQTLIEAGKPYQLLLLPGTHLLEDPLLATRVGQERTAFFARTLR